MPILGDLTEFPLPEVLLLIGSRTGKLRILDIPEANGIELDICLGEVQALHVNGETITHVHDLLDKLSEVIIHQGGMFDFKSQPVVTVPRPTPLTVHQMVIALVCHVDHQIEQRRTSRFKYELTYPVPDVWVEPELNSFLIEAQQHLTSPGAYAVDLSKALAVDLGTVVQNLHKLWQVGILKLVEDSPTLTFPQFTESLSEISGDRNNAFLEAARLSSKLPAYRARTT